MKALATLVIGEKAKSIWNVVSPVFKMYSERCGAELLVIDQKLVCARGGEKFEKLQLFDILAAYERVLYLDVDVLICPDCPSLFDVVPADRFGAQFHSIPGTGSISWPCAYANAVKEDKLDWGVIDCEIQHIQKVYGDIGWSSPYFNSGVMIASREHASVFDYHRNVEGGVRFRDQTYLNYRVQELRCPIMDLGAKYNYCMAVSRSRYMFNNRFSNYIIHYAGFNEFYPELSLIDFIASDVCAVYG